MDGITDLDPDGLTTGVFCIGEQLFPLKHLCCSVWAACEYHV